MAKENPKQKEEELEVDDLEVVDESATAENDTPQALEPTAAEEEAVKGEAPDLSAPQPPAAPQPKQRSFEELLEEYKVVNAEYEKLQAARNEIDAKMTELGHKLYALKPVVQNETMMTPKTNQESIMGYINSQKAIRLARAARRSEVLKGLQIHDVLPVKGSKLDESMARKRGFGTRRPMYPGKISE